MRRRALKFAATAAVVAAGAAVAAPATTADSVICPNEGGGYACFWTGYGYTGNKVIKGASFAGQGWQTFDNGKFSMKNHTNKYVCMRTVNNVSIGVAVPGREINFVGGPGIRSFKMQGNSNC